MMRPPSGWLGRAPSDRESYIPYNYSYQTSPHARYPPFCSTCCCDGFFAGRGDGVFSDRVGLFTGDVVTSSGLFIRVPSSGAPSVSSQIFFGQQLLLRSNLLLLFPLVTFFGGVRVCCCVSIPVFNLLILFIYCFLPTSLPPGFLDVTLGCGSNVFWWLCWWCGMWIRRNRCGRGRHRSQIHCGCDPSTNGSRWGARPYNCLATP